MAPRRKGTKPAKTTRRTESSPTDVAYLGPQGTFSGIAAKKLFPQDNLKPMPSVPEIGSALEASQTLCAVLPLQNSDAGFVPDTMMILTYRLPLFVTGIVDLPIRFSLYRLDGDDSPVTQVLSHPVALTQCDVWIKERKVRAIHVYSTAEGPALVASQRMNGLGAIAPSGQSRFFGLKEVEVDLQGPHPNRTRFVRLERRRSDERQVRRIVAGAEGALGMANLLSNKLLASADGVEVGAFKSAKGLGAFSYVLCAELKRPMTSKTLLKARFAKGAWLIGWTA